MSDELSERELRIVLDSKATAAYEVMVARMKETVSTIKVQPSHFVSFLMTDYFEAHFERDMAVLIAEFFDSDAFHEAERRLAKGKPNYEELMQTALDRARLIKGKKRRKVKRTIKEAEGTKEAMTS